MTTDRKKQQTVIADVGDLKADWLRWCAERGLTSSAGLKGLVLQALNGEASDVSVEAGSRSRPQAGLIALQVIAQQDQAPRIGREIYFTASEHAAVEAAGRALGLGFHELVIASVRAALAHLPTYGQQELEAVTESNRQLAQVVMDLGALRRGGVPQDFETQISELEATVRAHVESVSRLVAQGARRWEIKIS